VKEGLGLMRFSLSKTDHAPWAAMVTARSAYLTAFDIFFDLLMLSGPPKVVMQKAFLGRKPSLNAYGPRRKYGSW
jgi:phage-related baseplate assembly protein